MSNSSANHRFTFIDLFAGIGGFHEAMKTLGGKCVAACEIDEKARKTYISNHSIPEDKFFFDIKNIPLNDLPKHDILCAGFPCQSFSQAGFKKGFDDDRGALFFNIIDILKSHQPKAFFLENVRHLKNHDNGKTFERIQQEIKKINYNLFSFIVYAKDHGVPQLRARLFLIGLKDSNIFHPPKSKDLHTTMSDILGGQCDKKIGYTIRVGGRKSPLNGRHNWDGYIVDGKEVRLNIKQAAAMQGLPINFLFPVSNQEAMKQLGNSVAVPAIQDYAVKILETLNL